MQNERVSQDNKWGEQTHSGHAWMSILMEEVGELAKAINEDKPFEITAEAVQCAAVLCAMFEQHRGETALKPAFGKWGN